MASIQILELTPLETSIEDLSDDLAMSINGGLVDEVLGLVQQALQQGFLTAEQIADAGYGYFLEVAAACQDSSDINACFASYGIV